MPPAVDPLTAGEKPSEAGWYVAFVPETGETEIVRVRDNYTVSSKRILSVTLSGSGNHYPVATTTIAFIARIYPDRIEAREVA